MLTDIELDLGDLPIEEVYSDQLAAPVTSAATESSVPKPADELRDLFDTSPATSVGPPPVLRTDPQSSQLQMTDLFSAKPLVIQGRYTREDRAGQIQA